MLDYLHKEVDRFRLAEEELRKEYEGLLSSIEDLGDYNEDSRRSGFKKPYLTRSRHSKSIWHPSRDDGLPSYARWTRGGSFKVSYPTNNKGLTSCAYIAKLGRWELHWTQSGIITCEEGPSSVYFNKDEIVRIEFRIDGDSLSFWEFFDRSYPEVQKKLLTTWLAHA